MSARTSSGTPAPRAVVVGAGPVGCLAAQVLARHGYTVDVHEKRPHYTEHGLRYDGRTINLSLSPRGIDALDGFCDRAALDRLVVPMDRRVRHRPDGRVDAAGYGRDDWRNLSIDRNDLNLLLMTSADAVPAVRFTFGTECTGVDPVTRRVALTDRRGRSWEAEYDLLVGADGTHSAVRDRLAEQGLTHCRQHRTGVEYREITLRPPDEDGGGYGYGDGGGGGDGRMTPRAIHVWPRDGFFMVGLPSHDGSLRCTLVLPREGSPGSPDSPCFPAFADLMTEEALRAFLSRHFPDAAEIFHPAEPDPSKVPVTPISVLTTAPVVHDGSVLLVGDAAHTVAPFLGQGVNLGLEDCAVLARSLARLPGDQAAALDAYQRERLPEHEAAAALSLANYAELNGTGPRPAGPDAVPLPTLVNFVSSTYREALDIYTRDRRVPVAARPSRPNGG
ncbi:NAD(P)/FAD-dependent oxidoreductase [Streptomyces sp. JV176]|uniref:FAD-dependent oxidoreductase n=1 Tax=Streptomyces sp. JV176 TaxID=858630 RepID=UPI002E78354A|nr:NAD(P)/FAD-dependent oxidoreductase [Streptomyces sp. JV176]MEE1799001.1 NAD(P)/FAD-dependent oxidoreductase [Streptomyces sp. JV176]